MSWKKFADDCPGCRPVILDVVTGKPYSADDPIMQAMNRAWLRTTKEHRLAFHRVTCLNSRSPGDLTVMKQIATWFKEEMGDEPV